jgi:hypothetical protein
MQSDDGLPLQRECPFRSGAPQVMLQRALLIGVQTDSCVKQLVASTLGMLRLVERSIGVAH